MREGRIDDPRRDPARVMRLSRLGSLHQSRLSFMRILLRRMAAEGWRVTRPVFEIEMPGVGHAVYTAEGPTGTYSLVAFAHDLPDEMRSDRVIAEAWDATFALVDGRPTAEDIDRLSRNVPVQEAGRLTERELTLSRANRSARLWTHTVDALAAGRQPDAERLEEVGYLMRTTAVYGSGKFGAADREVIAGRPEMQAPFQAEMLTVWLIRTFVRDLVNCMAALKGGARAVTLDPGLARRLGIGNSTGLGMAPFIVNHPVLFNNWIAAREEALARVRAVDSPTPEAVALFTDLLDRTARALRRWRSGHSHQAAKIALLRADLSRLKAHLGRIDLTRDHPWDGLIDWSEAALSEEGQELLVSLVLEPYGALVDDLAAAMCDPAPGMARIDGTMTVAMLRAILEDVYAWALLVDWSAPEACARLWYVSEEKLEPRLGERFSEPLDAFEQPLAPGRDAAALHRALADWPEEAPVAELLLAAPEHRAAVRRAQLVRAAPYAEIRDNTIGHTMLPIDMLRAKLSFIGATAFDPRSDRWVRISMYGGAPYPETLSPETAAFWTYTA